MKTPIAFTLLVLGTCVLLTPIMLSFLLTMTGNAGTVNADDRISCQIAGAAMLIAGTIMAVTLRSNNGGGQQK
jgi:hypothetical protein